MKLSDDEYDEKSNKAIAILLGIVCGLFTAYACSIDLDAACIFIAILIGNILALKVDGIHHIATMASFIIAFLFLGLQSFWNSSYRNNGFIHNSIPISWIAIFHISFHYHNYNMHDWSNYR